MQGKQTAIYARFSTDLQSERSVDDQIQLCREYKPTPGQPGVLQIFEPETKVVRRVY
jgi:DNA invertase Pin-like site-specific DNA recombinase